MKAVRGSGRRVLTFCLAAAGSLASQPSFAAPWADVGSDQLRSDVSILAAWGLIDNVTMQWPLPWGSIVARLSQPIDLDGEPDYVREADERLEDEGREAVQVDQMHYGATMDFTNLPSVVRGFDALGRQDAQGQVYAEWVGQSTAIRLQVGAQTTNIRDKQTLLLDGSYIAQRIGGVAVYAGYLTHWWGPGWDTALSLSNNARPFPQIGYRRLSTTPFSWPILSWLGPWNHEMFFGIFDDPRMARNTLFHATRFEFNPFTGFEFALAKLTEFCGTGHPCEPIEELTNFKNGNEHQSKSKDEVDFDLKYTNTFHGLTYEVYNQEMNRDTGPFVHSDTSHLFGMSVWVPIRRTAIRFTAEYADTISTKEFFSFGNDLYDITYTDFKYTDGWQYRGRTLGSSLDTDSRLASFHASWTGAFDATYTLSYYRAYISSPNSAAGFLVNIEETPTPGRINLVTTAPVALDLGEARVHFPLRTLSVDLAVRLQDDQPRPQRGFAAAGELKLSYQL